MKKRLWAVVLAMLGGAASVASAQSIGVSFAEDDGGVIRVNQTLAPEDVAGYPSVAQANWNNFILSQSPGTDLVDSTGAAAGVSVSWAASNAWGDGGADTSTPDGRLARGNFDDGQTSDGVGVDVSVTGIPYSDYSVVLYLSSDQGAGGEFGVYTANGVGKKGGETLSISAYGGWVPGDNVLLYTGLSGDLSLKGPNRAGSVRGTIAGFQIVAGTVAIPEPCAAVLGVVGCALGLIRRRRGC